MKELRKALLVALAAVLVAGMAGCAKVAEKAVERVTEEAIEGETGNEVDITEDGVTVEGQDGSSVVAGEEVEIPDKFPEDVPVYDGKVTTVFTNEDVATLTIETSDSAADVIEWYAKELKDEGWAQESTMTSADSAMFAAKKGERMVTVIANNDTGTDGATVVTLSAQAE